MGIGKKITDDIRTILFVVNQLEIRATKYLSPNLLVNKITTYSFKAAKLDTLSRSDSLPPLPHSHFMAVDVAWSKFFSLFEHLELKLVVS